MTVSNHGRSRDAYRISQIGNGFVSGEPPRWPAWSPREARLSRLLQFYYSGSGAIREGRSEGSDGILEASGARAVGHSIWHAGYGGPPNVKTLDAKTGLVPRLQ